MDRSEKWKHYRFLKTNDLKCSKEQEIDYFFTERTNFLKDFYWRNRIWKTPIVFLKEWFCFRTKFRKHEWFFSERMIILNEQFYWTIILWEKERNKWKMNGYFENEQNHFFTQLEKNYLNWSFTNDKRTKWKNLVCPSLDSTPRGRGAAV